MSIFDQFTHRYVQSVHQEMSLHDYLDICREDAMAYASAAERMLRAIGEPEMLDTRCDPRLGRIFSNKVMQQSGQQSTFST